MRLIVQLQDADQEPVPITAAQLFVIRDAFEALIEHTQKEIAIRRTVLDMAKTYKFPKLAEEADFQILGGLAVLDHVRTLADAIQESLQTRTHRHRAEEPK